MRKMTKLYTLLGILLVVCAAAFVVTRYEGKKEQIKNSGEVILEIPTENVTAVSWTNDSGTFSFSKEEKWVYDDDNAFPTDEEKINSLLEQFESFAAAFTIDDVEDYSQYGLDDPACKISITAGDESYNIELGDFSKMDEQRYISIGDGKVYLAAHDPLDEYDAVLRDMILDDTLPEFDTAQQIDFSGSENYTIVRDESIKSICADDIFFADGQPLDTDNVNSFLSSVQSLSLTNYVSYNVSDAELEKFGMNEPELTINLEYAVTDDDGNVEDTGSLTIYVSRNPEELAKYEKAVEKEEEDLPAVTCYARIGDSQIVYEISQSEYDSLTACAYNTLRHQELFTADFDSVTSIDARLNGETYTFEYEPPESKKDEDEGTWKYNGEEFDVQNLKSSLSAISASDFTDEKPEEQEEISLTVHLDNEDFPEFTLTLYRYDGTNCLAEVDGNTVAFASRDKTVALVEAVNKLILGS